MDCEADELQLSRAIYNIALNSRQALHNNGAVKVSAHNVTRAENKGFIVQNRKYVKVMISDNGKGILPEHKEKIFNTYFTTRRKSNGLGLSFVKSRFRDHGGHIIVDSVKERGSTFTIYLSASEV